MRWAGHVERMVERRGVYMFLVGQPGGKRQLGRDRRSRKDNGIRTGSSWLRIGTGGGHL